MRREGRVGGSEGDAVVDVCGVRKRSRPNDSCKSSAAERKSLHGKKKKKTASAAPSDERVRNTFIVQIVLSIYHQRLLQDY